MALQWKSGAGTDLPNGGTKGQALVKKSDANQDVEWGDAGSGIVDQTYDPTSTNAQSGTAVAEALGGVTIPSLPAGGTTEQILAKKSDADDDAEWVDDTGKYLMKEERPYGYHEETRQVPHTTVEWQTDIASSYFTFTAHQYQVGGTYTPPHLKLAAAGSYANIEMLWGAIRNLAIPVSKDAVRVVCNAGELLKNGTQTTRSGYTFYPVKVGNSTFYLRTSNPLTGKDADLVSTITTDTTFDISSVCTVSLAGIHSEKGVEKTTYTEETVQVTDYIHNVTGVVLDDLKVSGDAIPTDWGVALSNTVRVNKSSTDTQTTIDVSSFGFESVDDYQVVFATVSGGNMDWGSTVYFLSSKTATSFRFTARNASSNQDFVIVGYTIFAKGYGNVQSKTILESPNGTKYKLKVADDGSLSTEAV